MKNKLLQLMAWVCFALQVKAQSPNELENKYWNYRDKLRKYFVQVGPNAGQSIPAADIITHGNSSDTFRIVNGTEVHTSRKSYNGKIEYGDATVDHGWYLAVLASEYWLLRHKGQINTDQYKALLNELYFALMAVDRLDKNAEPYLNYSEPTSKNGFFVRSDNPSDFLKYFRYSKNDHQAIENMASGGSAGPEILYVDTTGGSLRVYDPDSFRIDIAKKNSDGTIDAYNAVYYPGGPGQYGSAQNLGNEMSQDQVYGLMLGFMAIKKWVDTGLTVWPNNDPNLSSKNIVSWVSEITDRIVDHVSQTRSDPIYIKDEYDYYTAWQKKCADIYAHPYVRHDTSWLTTPDTFIVPTFDSDGHFVKSDTSIIAFHVIDTIGAAYFTGSVVRVCDPWDSVQLWIKKKSGKFFKEANYIIMDPVRDWNPVTRGHFALPFAYPLREIAKYITGESYPDPFGKLKTGWQAVKYGSDIIFVVGEVSGVAEYGGYSITVPKALLYTANSMRWVTAVLQFLTIVDPQYLQLMDNDPNFAAQVFEAFGNSGCGLFMPSLDLVTTCLIGKPLIPADKDFWRDLWNAIGKKTVFKAAFKGKNPLNMIHNLAIASGTWTHDDFSDWCDYMGFDYSELLYAMYNGHTPKKSRSYYESALNAAQCEGINHPGGNEFAGGDIVSIDRLSFCAPFNQTFLFAQPTSDVHDPVKYPVSYYGLDYMLTYNLFRMADELYWGSETANLYVRSNCPCQDYPAIHYTSPVRSILEEYTPNHYFSIDGRNYNNWEAFMPVTSISAQTVDVKPLYDYYKNYVIRIPEYLNHNLSMTGTNSTTGLSKLYVEQDLSICNGYVSMNNYSKIEMVAGSNENFPSELRINSGSTVEMKNGSTILINDNNHFIVEENATLKYASGAHIILNGSNAVLHIKGTLQIAAGTTFQIEGGSAGKGYIIWESNHKTIPNNPVTKIIGGINSKIFLGDNIVGGVKQKALVVQGPVGMQIPKDVVDFTIKDCRMDIASGSFVYSDAGNTALNNVNCIGLANGDGDYKGGGVIINGGKNDITHCDFSYLLRGLTTINIANKLRLNVDSTNFYNCDVGINSQAGAVNFINGSITWLENQWQGPSNWQATGVTSPSFLKNITLDAPEAWSGSFAGKYRPNQFSNIDFHGTGSVILKDCQVKNAENGVVMYEGQLRPLCSDFINHKLTALSLSTALYRGDENYNQFHQIGYWFDAINASLLYLDQGKSAMRYIGMSRNYQTYAEFLSPKQDTVPSSGYSNPVVNPGAIAATEYYWSNPTPSIPAYPDSVAQVKLVHVVNGSTMSYIQPLDLGIEAVLNAPGGSLAYMNSFDDWDIWRSNICDNWKLYHPTDSVSHIAPVAHGSYDAGDHDLIPPSGFSGSEDIGIAVGKWNRMLVPDSISPIDYAECIAGGQWLMSSSFPSTDGLLAFDIYRKTQDVYNLSLGDTTLPDSLLKIRNHTFAQTMLDFQDTLISKADNHDVTWNPFVFELKRDRAILLRSDNQRSEALGYITSVRTGFSEAYQNDIFDRWYCIIEREQMFLDTLLSPDSIYLESCISAMVLDDTMHSYIGGSPFAAMPRRDDMKFYNSQSNTLVQNNEQTKQQGLTIFPNPAQNSVTLWSSKLILSIQISDGTGRFIKAIDGRKANAVTLDVSYLARGLYVIKVCYMDGQEQKWLAINK